MKKKLIFLCLLLFIAYILTAPKDAVNAASVGLVLWYTRVLPTLLPFVILSNILMDSNYLQYLNKSPVVADRNEPGYKRCGDFVQILQVI